MRPWGIVLVVAVAAATCAETAPAATPVAVFNFQMKSDTSDWKGLEKGLSDRITTDFTRVRGVTVVARDEMQIMAQALHWVPELATTDAKAAGTIKAQLKIDTIVTGVYSVEGDRIHLTGQIIDVSTRKEVARKEIEGPAQDVLELQRQLSAELLSVLVEKPAAGILASLPVWTRSLPATKALYEGMDLCDQGRYAEAWLKFRQAETRGRHCGYCG
jgi:TolB-like protein